MFSILVLSVILPLSRNDFFVCTTSVPLLHSPFLGANLLNLNPCPPCFSYTYRLAATAGTLIEFVCFLFRGKLKSGCSVPASNVKAWSCVVLYVPLLDLKFRFSELLCDEIQILVAAITL